MNEKGILKMYKSAFVSQKCALFCEIVFFFVFFSWQITVRGAVMHSVCK